MIKKYWIYYGFAAALLTGINNNATATAYYKFINHSEYTIQLSCSDSNPPTGVIEIGAGEDSGWPLLSFCSNQETYIFAKNDHKFYNLGSVKSPYPIDEPCAYTYIFWVSTPQACGVYVHLKTADGQDATFCNPAYSGYGLAVETYFSLTATNVGSTFTITGQHSGSGSGKSVEEGCAKNDDSISETGTSEFTDTATITTTVTIPAS